MLLTLGLSATLLLGYVSAFPPPTPAAKLARAAASPAPGASAAPSYSVGAVTIEYIVGMSTAIEVETYTDYGSVLPSAILAEYGTAAASGYSSQESDPCGPKVQDSYQPPTCLSSGQSASSSNLTSNGSDQFAYDPSYIYQSPDPEIYGVQCKNSSTDATAINTKSCDLTTVDICNKIRYAHSPRDKWVWSTAGAGCAMAYWLPASNGGAPAPLKTRCEQGIYESMVYSCVKVPDYSYGVSNLASVNLVKIPGGANGTGQQVNAGYPSYIVAAAPIKLSAPTA